MNKMKNIVFVVSLVLLLGMAGCSNNAEPGSPTPSPTPTPEAATGQIYLYGEAHAVESILERELELWSGYYHEEGMRHLFVEAAYYDAEFLNIWMQSDNDDILRELYGDWQGSSAHDPLVYYFYKQIKEDCPETVFHGTDVGHCYETTGIRYLKHLEYNDLKDSESYKLAEEAIEQGEQYYMQLSDAYRENKMVENFIREFEALDGEHIMGIYGAAHTGLDSLALSGNVACMAKQLKEEYGDIIHSEDLSWMARDIEPIRTDIITVNGKEYEASYYGEEDIYWTDEYSYREFWRLEDAYEDFKDAPKTGDGLPCTDYPMLIETGQVFVLDYTKADGTVERWYYRSDGTEVEGWGLATETFTIK